MLSGENPKDQVSLWAIACIFLLSPWKGVFRGIFFSGALSGMCVPQGCHVLEADALSHRYLVQGLAPIFEMEGCRASCEEPVQAAVTVFPSSFLPTSSYKLPNSSSCVNTLSLRVTPHAPDGDY